MDIDKFQTELESLLKADNIETAMRKEDDPPIGTVLRALLPVTKEGDMVLTEIMVAPFTEGALLLQLYSTMIMEIGPGYEAVKEMLLEWNLVSPLGAFGIYRKERQLYHKYTYPFPEDSDPAEMAPEVYYILAHVQDVIADIYPDAVRLSGHQ